MMMPTTFGGLLARVEVGGGHSAPYWSVRSIPAYSGIWEVRSKMARASQGFLTFPERPMCAYHEPRTHAWVRDEAGLTSALVRDAGLTLRFCDCQDDGGLGGRQVVVLAPAVGMGGLKRKGPLRGSDNFISSTRTAMEVAKQEDRGKAATVEKRGFSKAEFRLLD